MADPSNISSRVASFIRTYVKSVWQLDLLVHMSACAQPTSVAEVADTLYLPPDVIEEGLKYWQKCGLLKRSEDAHNVTYTFEPASHELGGTVEQTAKIYSQRRVAIINLIFSNPASSMSRASESQIQD